MSLHSVTGMIAGLSLLMSATFVPNVSAADLSHLRDDSAAALLQLERMPGEIIPQKKLEETRGGALSAAQIAYYAWARWGVKLTVNAAAYISTRWKPGTITALGNILAQHYGCRPCGGGGGGSW